MTSTSPIDLNKLNSLLGYNPFTGTFTWKKGPRTGKEAGCKRRDGYVVVRIDQVLHYVHRIAFLLMRGVCSKRIDHKDGDTSNTTWANLREASQSQNMANARKGGWLYPRGVKKVESGRFEAAITVNYQRFHLGTFDTVEEASKAYQERAFAVWGEFVR